MRDISLINGRFMVCPRCERPHDILQYIPLQTIQKFLVETNPIYKCPKCKWIFSPSKRMNGIEDE